ncbi:nicotinate-nucleotide adenylyltransferase [Nitrospira sp. Kam-Ns4a]
MRIGLFGGTFNPIHRCHLRVAAETRDRLKLDQVLFIPSGDPPHKPAGDLAPVRHRVEMVRLAIAGEPSLALSEIEARQTMKSYSIATVQTLRQTLPADSQLFFIVGLDAFLEFPTWREAARLRELCHFAVISRPGSLFRSLAGLALLPPLDPAALAALDAGTRDRLDLPLTPETSLTLLRLPPCEQSASEIRSRVKRGLSISSLLPASVESYIIRHNLYQEGTDRTGL